MQVWLDPLESWQADTPSPLCSVMTRMGYALDSANIPSDQVHQLGVLAATIFPGNLKERASELDIDSYAMESIRTERDRLDFPRHLQHELQIIEKQLGQGNIDWCLPVVDIEFNIAQVAQFVRELRGQNWLTIYVISDVDVSNFFLNQRNVKVVNETTFKALAVQPGIPKSLARPVPPPPPTPAPTPAYNWPPQGNQPTNNSFFDIDEEEEIQEDKPQQKKKGRPQYRSITDDYDPSW